MTRRAPASVVLAIVTALAACGGPSAAPVATAVPTPLVTPAGSTGAGPATPSASDAGGLQRLSPMNVPRAAFTATTLLDGRVLLTGGFGTDAQSDPASTEIFDPTTARFTVGPRMSAPRLGHSATLLRDGRVLVAGGLTPDGGALDTAELFNPSTSTFEATGRMTTTRADHEAVRLDDGRVLVLGGTGPNFEFRSSAEVYDPASGSFAATGELPAPMESMTATLLNDGRVLVTGGHNGRHADITIFATTELFDPASGTFSTGPAMATPRHKHDAVALAGGRILVLGGSDARDDAGRYASTEVFDPATSTFASGPTMAAVRYKFRLTSLLLPDGRVVVAGGADVPEVLDRDATAFTPMAGDLGRQPVFAVAAELVDGRVLLAGGYSLSGPATAAAWLLSP